MPSIPSPTEIARVSEVRGARVRAGLVAGVAGTTPQYRGRIYRIGQVGSIVRIPVGPVELLGSVVTLGIAEAATASRWLEIELLGEIDAFGIFRRGVTDYPALDDAVHLVTDDVFRQDLSAAWTVSRRDRPHRGSERFAGRDLGSGQARTPT